LKGSHSNTGQESYAGTALYKPVEPHKETVGLIIPDHCVGKTNHGHLFAHWFGELPWNEVTLTHGAPK
jgi:hypothetical protein